MLTPIRLLAEAARGFWSQPWPLIGDHPLMRGAAAACEILSRSGARHQRPEFGIASVRVAGQDFAVREEAARSHPFCTLLHFAKVDYPVEQPRVLVVAPLSGHFATLLRGTIETLLQDHD
ncbi:MAG: polyhydroxyalkanoate depolymerase, partial [Alphaproteobacteria bacterium]|nr:polyhydroxyalkanoate depolymerase [Alphaproteobacteria bacterium]